MASRSPGVSALKGGNADRNCAIGGALRRQTAMSKRLREATLRGLATFHTACDHSAPATRRRPAFDRRTRGDEARPDRLRGRRPGERDELVGRVRDRPRRNDPRHGHRAGHGDIPRSVGDPGDRRRHDHGLPVVPAAGGAVGDDARAHRRVPLVRVSRLQGAVAQLRKTRQRLHGLGVLARLVPGGAAQHDPRLVLHHREVQPVTEGLHAHPHADRLLDDHHLDHRHPARVHSRLARHPLRRAPSRPCSAWSR